MAVMFFDRCVKFTKCPRVLIVVGQGSQTPVPLLNHRSYMEEVFAWGKLHFSPLKFLARGVRAHLFIGKISISYHFLNFCVIFVFY